MERWLALTEHKNPMVRVYVFRDLMRFGFGLAPQEIKVERHASAVNVHLAAVADPAKYLALEEARAKVRSLLLDGHGAPIERHAHGAAQEDRVAASMEDAHVEAPIADGRRSTTGDLGGHEA
jgi:hypothetical protein